MAFNPPPPPFGRPEAAFEGGPGVPQNMTSLPLFLARVGEAGAAQDPVSYITGLDPTILVHGSFVAKAVSAVIATEKHDNNLTKYVQNVRETVGAENSDVLAHDMTSSEFLEMDCNIAKADMADYLRVVCGDQIDLQLRCFHLLENLTSPQLFRVIGALYGGKADSTATGAANVAERVGVAFVELFLPKAVLSDKKITEGRLKGWFLDKPEEGKNVFSRIGADITAQKGKKSKADLEAIYARYPNQNVEWIKTLMGHVPETVVTWPLVTSFGSEEFWNLVKEIVSPDYERVGHQILALGLLAYTSIGQVSAAQAVKFKRDIREWIKGTWVIDDPDWARAFRIINYAFIAGKVKHSNVMRSLLYLFPESTMMAILNKVKRMQSQCISSINTIHTAICRFPANPIWGYLEKHNQNEMRSFLIALAISRSVVCPGLLPKSARDILATSNFPTWSAAGKTLMMMSGHATTLSQLKSSVSMMMFTRIKALVGLSNPESVTIEELAEINMSSTRLNRKSPLLSSVFAVDPSSVFAETSAGFTSAQDLFGFENDIRENKEEFNRQNAQKNTPPTGQTDEHMET